MNFPTFVDSINWIQIVLAISIVILLYLRILRGDVSLNKKRQNFQAEVIRMAIGNYLIHVQNIMLQEEAPIIGLSFYPYLY